MGLTEKSGFQVGLNFIPNCEQLILEKSISKLAIRAVLAVKCGRTPMAFCLDALIGRPAMYSS